jgi:RimJ/RimL family protein N-acetyltransferase
VQALYDDPDVRHWNWRGPPPNSARETVHGAVAQWHAGWGAGFAIVAEERFAGLVFATVRKHPVMRQAELGYMLLPAARGHGYATRAVRLVSSWLLEDLELVRVQARTHPDNPASWRVLERAGFRREGIARAGAVFPGTGEAYDTEMWSLVAEDAA